jgi:two-component system response regulator AtoC
VGIATTDDQLALVLETEIRSKGYHAIRCRDLPNVLRTEPTLVFAEWVCGDGLAGLLAGLSAAAQMVPPVPVIALVPAGAVALMQRARFAGAVDALFSPPEPEEIHAEIQYATEPLAFLDPIERDRFQNVVRDRLVGESPSFRRSLDEMRLAARSEANVLLLGETGTGKEMFANAIHSLSQRSGSPYRALICPAIPVALLESELFGTAKGAFTGAADRIGRLGEVGAGTLLLDEVGDIELGLQVKLLRVIEQRIFQRLGENQDRKFLARLISATSVNIEQALAAGRFRPDFLGRIKQFQIVLPPLRERRSDIPLLAHHFLEEHSQAHAVDISPSALEVLQNYDFPMNVRELENAIIEALGRSNPGRVILPRHLPKEIVSPTLNKVGRPQDRISIPPNLTYQDARVAAQREIDRIYLKPLMEKHRGNQSRVAKEVGVDRDTLAARLENIKSDQGAPNE